MAKLNKGKLEAGRLLSVQLDLTPVAEQFHKVIEEAGLDGEWQYKTIIEYVEKRTKKGYN